MNYLSVFCILKLNFSKNELQDIQKSKEHLYKTRSYKYWPQYKTWRYYHVIDISEQLCLQRKRKIFFTKTISIFSNEMKILNSFLVSICITTLFNTISFRANSFEFYQVVIFLNFLFAFIDNQGKYREQRII